MPKGEHTEGPFSRMTPEQRAECGRKGGIKSGEVKRQKKAMRETLEVLMSMPIKTGKSADIESIKNFTALKGKNINVQEALLVSMLQKALKGDVKAAEYIRDTAGEKPANKIKADLDMELPDVLENMQAMSDILLQSRPNRDIKDFE